MFQPKKINRNKKFKLKFLFIGSSWSVYDFRQENGVQTVNQRVAWMNQWSVSRVDLSLFHFEYFSRGHREIFSPQVTMNSRWRTCASSWSSESIKKRTCGEYLNKSFLCSMQTVDWILSSFFFERTAKKLSGTLTRTSNWRRGRRTLLRIIKSHGKLNGWGVAQIPTKLTR